MYVSGMNPLFGFFFATTTLIIARARPRIKVYNWVLTLWRADIHFTTPMLFALGFIVTFVNGGLTGLFLGNVIVDVPLSATMFVVAHFHMVMGVAPILVIFGAIYHWYPKITGRMLDETLGKIHFWITFLGAYAIFFPMHYLGLARRAAPLLRAGRDRLRPAIRRHALNIFITVAALIVGAAQVDLLLQPVLEPAPRQAGRRQSVARHVARMADAGDAARSRQLGQGAAGRLSLGLRLQRARRAGGFPAAERAAVEGRALAMSVDGPVLRPDRRHRRHGGWRGRACCSPPWLEEGEIADFPGAELSPRPPAGEGGARGVSRRRRLPVLAAVRGAFSCAWTRRTGRRRRFPAMLWFNTGVLVASSVALQLARSRRRAARTPMRVKSWPAGRRRMRRCCSCSASLWAWRELAAPGLYASSNPANAFFYLLTGDAWAASRRRPGRARAGRPAQGLERRRATPMLAASVELCAIYWHFLLFVWLLLFAMLAGWADDFGVICRRLLS